MAEQTTTGRAIVQERAAEVISNAAAGAYRHLVLRAPGIAAAVRPGQFVACAVGREDGTGALLLRRAFSVHRADAVAGTVEVVVAPHAPGTEWVCRRAAGDLIDVVGPAGRGFVAPESLTAPAVLVGGGYGAAPLGWFADDLRARGHASVDVIVGAADSARLFGHDDAEQRDDLHVVTEDGSRGDRGRVTDVLTRLLAQRPAGAVVYACGPMGMLRAVHQVAEQHSATSQLAVEESMACGVGVCMTCVLPVVGTDGVTRMTRSCVDGPVFAGTALRWDAIDILPGRTSSRVPDDCLGAPLPTGGH